MIIGSWKIWDILFASVAVIGLPSAAWAQGAGTPVDPPSDEAQAPDPGQATSEDPAITTTEQTGDNPIVVTGSRVARAGFTAPTPTTVLGEGFLNAVARNNIGDSLAQLPAFRADYSAASAGPRAFFAGATYANLRGLGSVRTLTLVDRRRHVPTSTSGQVDLNLIPSVLVSRIDVVTGGASAAYGSDAVAGVTNVILKTDIDGIEGNASYGISAAGDNEELNVGIAAGTSFAGDRGSIVIGGEYVDNKGTGSVLSRDWGREEYALLANPTPADGRGAQLLLPHVHFSNQAPGGLIVSGPLRGLQFLPGGATAPFEYGTDVGPSLMVGGQGFGETTYQALIAIPLQRTNALAHLRYALTDGIEAFVEASYARSRSVSRGLVPRDSGTTAITVRRDNAYLPASVRDAMVAANVTTISVGRNNLDYGFSNIDTRTQVQRYVGGLKGTFGSGWSWETYYQYGESRYSAQNDRSRNNVKFTQAVDAVVDPASGGIVCRSTLTDPNNGCIPYNIFGSGSPSPQAIAAVEVSTRNQIDYSQHVAAANLTGEPFSTWAGPVSVAMGAEYRREKATSVWDPFTLAGVTGVANKNLSGQFNVKEAYVETVVPLLADSPLGRSLEVNAALRVTEYSTSGRVETWKLGATYQIVDPVRLRVTQSRDIRAPNIAELYTQASDGRVTTFDPLTNTTNVASVITTGNPSLEPEKANSFTAGIVLTPMPGLSVSADYYSIEVDGAIGTATAADTLNRCIEGVTSFCSFIVRDEGGALLAVTLPFINFSTLKTRGVDFELAYNSPLDRFFPSTPGSISLRGLVTYVDTLSRDDGVQVIDRAGEAGNSGLSAFSQPHWKWNAILGYSDSAFSFNIIERYVGGGTLDATFTPQSIAVNHVASRYYTDLTAAYRIDRAAAGNWVEFFASVRNLFDKDPPPAPAIAGTPTNFALYDTIGQTFKAGVRFNF